MNCFRYLGYDKYEDLEEALYKINIMRVSEYVFKMQIHNLKRVDKEYDMHLQAWLNARVQDTKEKGKKKELVYRKFTDFYDYEKNVSEVQGRPKRSVNNQLKKAVHMASEIN